MTETKSEVQDVITTWHQAGERVALVPTMGNLHEGHLALVREAQQHADRVVASIFVNPTQFGEGEDFEKYPRTPDEDIAGLEAESCDVVFIPDTEQIYPFGVEQSVSLKASPDLAARLEGYNRPGHFDGVVSVVARLFAITRPDVAVFGEKDYQQLLVVRKLADDLGFGIDVIGKETIRDAAGLALSSRNAYLDPLELTLARQLNKVLSETGQNARQGDVIKAHEMDAAEQLMSAGLKVDYVAIRRADDLSVPEKFEGGLRILAAVRCGETRLIDNMPMPD
ncbi:MAG TPA: pantoate--beta-alanine ligase [Xanthomonadales bacterium]|nr:pantoate--beta-alanine ligase [Xanthomonadales bacterium]